MKELSLIKQMFSSIKAALTEDELERIKVVELQIGELTNIEINHLQNAFSVYKLTHKEFEHVNLITHEVPIAIHCDICDTESPVSNYIFRCKKCNAPSSKIVAGEELLIHKIHLREPIR